MPRVIDLHQHLWPEQLVEALRRARPCAVSCAAGRCTSTASRRTRRRRRPRHGRSARLRSRGGGRPGLCLALQPARDRGPPAEQAQPLLDAWHERRSRASRGAPGVGLGILGSAGRRRAPDSARRWVRRRSAAGDAADDARGMVGTRGRCSQRPRPPTGRSSCTRGRAPADASAAGRPAWWAPVVDYTAQLQAAWWAWHAFGGRARSRGCGSASPPRPAWLRSTTSG